jgi:hypothetical protein
MHPSLHANYIFIFLAAFLFSHEYDASLCDVRVHMCACVSFAGLFFLSMQQEAIDALRTDMEKCT